MPVVTACPDVSILQQLALGKMLPEEVEKFARHCEQCPRCIGVLHSLKVGDTLMEAMAAQNTAPDQSRDAAVNALIERLKQMPPPVSAAAEMTATTAEGNTPSGDAAGEFVVNTEAGEVSLSPPQAAGEIGRLGGYRVLRMLGAGGMGMVYQAEDAQLQRPIALKVMKAEVAKNPANRERFLREARAAAKLKSDHVVNIYQVGEERQIVFLAMEYLEGLSLADWLNKGRKPTLAQAARIGRQIALGLADAHACGLIHRDIKPANVWLDSGHQGRVKLLDFGLARGESEEAQLTQSGAIVGTPAYMSPEQARGERVDSRCDLFSLGVVLYRLTTGQMPFCGDNPMSILTALALDSPTPPRAIDPAIPPRMAALIESLLAKVREQRPKTAKAVAEELAAIEREAAIGAASVSTTVIRAESVSERPAQTAPLRSRLRWLVAASLLLLGGVAASIVVIVRDKQGNKIAEIEVPPGGSVEIKNDGKAKIETKDPPPRPVKPIAAATLPPLLPGEPLSPTALVRQPAKLPGVRGWTIETRPIQAALPDHAQSVAYRPDGKWLAVGSNDGLIRVWETETGRLVQILYAPNIVASLAWSPDGRVLAAGSHFDKNRVRLWEAESGRFLRALETPLSESAAIALVWKPDGRTLLSGHRACCFIWDVADGKLLRRFPLPAADPSAFSPDGKYLSGRPFDLSGIPIWDTATGKEVRKLSVYKKGPRFVAWSMDGKRLACAGEAAGPSAHDVMVWEIESGKEVLHVKDLWSYGVIWSPDGRAWALNPYNNNWTNLIAVDPDAKKRPKLDMCSGPWSPDGKTVVGLDPLSGTVHLHDAAGKRLRTLSDGNYPRPFYFRLSPDGKTVATIIGDRTILSSSDTGQIIAVLKDAGGWALDWSPDSKQLATTGPENALLIWSADGKTRRALVGHKGNVNSAAWSPDGKTLISIGFDKRLLFWNAESGERHRELGPFQGKPDWVRWSPDGRYFVFNEEGIGWHLWDVQRNKLANDPKQWSHNFIFAPGGRSVWTAEPYRLRDLATGKEYGAPSPACIYCREATPSWSRDGRLFALGRGATVELWSGDLRRRLRTLKSTSGNVEHFIDFSADGKLVAGRAGERLHVWETDTGRLRGITLLGEHNNGLTVAADGHYTGNEQVERGIVVVVQKHDGTQEVLEPADFEEKYGFKNDPSKVHLLQSLPPPPYPLPGQPMGPYALVREPAELPDANAASWTIETVNSRGHVKAAAYRPDGKLLATGGEDGTLRIWDTANGKLIRMFVGHHPVGVLSWSKDGKLLAAGEDRATLLWEVDTGRLLRRLPFGGSEQGVGWSPNENILAVNDGNGVLTLWDAFAERVVRTHAFQQHGHGLAWSPDGKTLALGFMDKTIRLWDVVSGKVVRKLEGHQSSAILGLAWSPDGKRLASTALNENNFLVWHVADGKLLGRFPVEVVWGMPTTIVWTPDSKAVALGALGFFDPDTGRRLGAGVEIVAKPGAAWPPGFKQVATFTENGVHLYDYASGKRTHTLERSLGNGAIYALAWSPSGGRLALNAAFEHEGALRVLDAATGRRQPPTLTDYIRVAVWSPDGSILAAIGGNGTVCLLDAASGNVVRKLEGTLGSGTMLEWSSDGKRLAGVGYEGLSMWSAETGKRLWRDRRRAIGVAWSPDGSRLVSTDNGQGKVRIWEAETGKILHEYPLLAESGLAWSPDSKTLLVGPMDQGEAVLIDGNSGAIRNKRAEGVRGTRCVRWSSDAKTFTTLTNQGLLRVWDAANCQPLRTAQLSGIMGHIPSAAWSSDGRMLAWVSGSAIHLNDRDGQPLGVLLPFDAFGQLAVTADGRYRGNARVERMIRMVVQKRDGTTETLTPHEFEQKYGFKNEPDKVRLTDK